MLRLSPSPLPPSPSVRARAWLNAVLSPLLLTTAAAAAAQETLPAGVAHLPSLLAAPCSGLAIYEPLAVYDFAGGVRIGSLVLDRPDWATQPKKPDAGVQNCLQDVKLQVQLQGKESGLDAPVLSLSTEPVLLVSKTQVSANTLWLMFQAGPRRFWLPQRQGVQFRSLERDLVQGLGAVLETCSEMGECRPTDIALRRLVDEAALLQSPNCPLPAYEVTAHRQLPSGRWVYEAELAPALQGRYAGRLPLSVRVPVRDSAGQWSGFFNPNPCQPPQNLPQEPQRGPTAPRPHADWQGFAEPATSSMAPTPSAVTAPAPAQPVRTLRHLPPLPPASGVPSVPAAPSVHRPAPPTISAPAPFAPASRGPLEFVAPAR